MNVARKQTGPPARTVRLAYIAADQNDEPGTSLSQGTESGDEFWMIAQWSRSAESLAFHAESLISWAPVEILERPAAVIDETGQTKWLCKFRYFGPVRDRTRLIENVKTVLASLTTWQPVRAHSL